MIYHETEHGILYCGDCLDILPTLADKSVDLVLTSPPYDNLREYGEGKGYCFTDSIFKPIANELYRITKQGGVCVWVVGDATINGNETGSSFRQALYFKEIGFNLHDTMIYEKAGFANPSKTRYHQIFEYMFILTIDDCASFNPICDRPTIWETWGKNTKRQKDGTLIDAGERLKYKGKMGMRYNIWRYATGGMGMSASNKIAHQHPAIFPEQLAIDHVKSWSNEKMTVLDCFGGSGTTAIACIRLNRKYILIEKEEKYCEIAAKRIETELDQTDLFRDES